jgi:hypothetical protein
MATLSGIMRLRARQLRPAALGLLLLTAACHLDRSPIIPDDAGLRAGAPARQATSAARVESGGAGGSVAARVPASGEVASAAARAEPVAGAPAAVAAVIPPPVQPTAAAGKPAPAAGSGGADTPFADGGSAGALAIRTRRCVAGPYSGTFEGSVELVQLSEFSRVTGSLNAELTPDGAEGLVLRNGQLRGTDQGENTLTAAITGRFSCITHRLENGKIEGGTYHLAALDMDIEFSGSAGGTQADEPPGASGSWVTASREGLLGGSGTWSLREGKN